MSATLEPLLFHHLVETVSMELQLKAPWIASGILATARHSISSTNFAINFGSK